MDSFQQPAWTTPRVSVSSPEAQNPFENFQDSSSPVPNYQQNPFDSYQSMPNVSPVSNYSTSSEASRPQEVNAANYFINPVCGATERAVTLLDQEFGAGATDQFEDKVDHYKKEIDLYREHGAGVRALSLLDKAVTGASGHAAKPTPQATPAEHYDKPQSERARMKAQYYHKKCEEKARMKAKWHEDKEKYAKLKPILLPTAKMAESSRRRKPLTAEAIRDPETVAGMKYKLHWDREKEAQGKALRLLQEEFH